MLDRIRKLEALARQLEPDAARRQRLNAHAFNYAEDFLSRIDELPAYVVTEDKGIGIYDAPITEEPTDITALLELLRFHVDRPGLNPASGGHLGYIPGGGIYPSALGDYLADVTNRYAGIFFGSPGAVRMEHMLLAWIASVAGYPASSAGNLTSGGSIANLIGIVTAREAQQIASAEVRRSPIYLTEHAHHSIDKAIRIAGLKECPLRQVPLDGRFRMRAEALEEMVAADKRAGLRPWLVIAAAGTTDVGAVDPLDRIAEIARRHGLWFHLDAAYGGFFILCEEGKKILRGMEASDSAVLDPHKGLFLPYGTGAVLVRERGLLAEAHHYFASYLQDAVAAHGEFSPADLSPELTKHFRGLRLWLPLKLFGLAPFRAGLEEKLLLTRYFYERLKETEGFEVGPVPDLSVAIYRYIPKRGDPDEFNRRLVDEVHRDGRVFLSSTTIGGKVMLRLAVLAFRTHLETIELSLRVLKEKVRLLEAR